MKSKISPSFSSSVSQNPVTGRVTRILKDLATGTKGISMLERLWAIQIRTLGGEIGVDRALISTYQACQVISDIQQSYIYFFNRNLENDQSQLVINSEEHSNSESKNSRN